MSRVGATRSAQRSADPGRVETVRVVLLAGHRIVCVARCRYPYPHVPFLIPDVHPVPRPQTATRSICMVPRLRKRSSSSKKSSNARGVPQVSLFPRLICPLFTPFHFHLLPSCYVLPFHVLASFFAGRWLLGDDMVRNTRPANPLKIITGRGTHSVNGVGVLKPAVRNALVRGGWNVGVWDGGLVVRGRTSMS